MPIGRVELLDARADSLPPIRLISFDPVPTLDLLDQEFKESTETHQIELELHSLKSGRLIRPLFIEPFSALWIVAAIGEGTLQWVGGRIMETIFGGNRDIEDIVRTLLRDFAAMVRSELRAEAMDAAIGRTDALQETMKGYGRAPDSDVRKATLPLMIIQSNELYSELRRLDLIALGALGIAANLKLALIVELYFLGGKDAREREGARELLYAYITHIEAMHKILIDITIKRFSPTTHEHAVTPPMDRYYYTFDGRRVSSRYEGSRDEVERERRRHMARVTLQQVELIIAPASANAEEIKRVIDGLPD
jgi:hypothetical protein